MKSALWPFPGQARIFPVLIRWGRKLKMPGRGVSASAAGQEAGERMVALSLGVGLVGRPALSAPCSGPEGLQIACMAPHCCPAPEGWCPSGHIS